MFQRSGTTGSTMLPMFWSGDNDSTFSPANGLPSVITAGLNAGLSAISLWISDLSGYNKTERTPGDDVLFSRWTEYSALSPGMELMNGMNLGPWDYGDEALRIFRKYSILHMSLFPYRYAAAMESAVNGLPMMRALVLMHQEDQQSRETANEYYFGPDLLVAPVVSKVTQRAVYLPPGDWIDYWTGRCWKGKQTATVEAPLERIPLFVRQGTVLPKIPEDVMTLVPQSEAGKVKALDDRRVYEIWAGEEKRQTIDFEGRKLDYDPHSGTLAVSGAPARITLRWRFTHPSEITVNGRKAEPSVDADGVTISFPHQQATSIAWK
jgi:alpha-D-xyloside xylohydrolase